MALRLAGRFPTPGILDGSPRTSFTFGADLAERSWAREATSRCCGRGGFCSLIGFPFADPVRMTILCACGAGPDASPQPYSAAALNASTTAADAHRRARARCSPRRGSTGIDLGIVADRARAREAHPEPT